VPLPQWAYIPGDTYEAKADYETPAAAGDVFADSFPTEAKPQCPQRQGPRFQPRPYMKQSARYNLDKADRHE